MIDRKKFSKVWALGQILVGIFIIGLALKQTGILQIIGLIGGIIWVTNQSIFLLKGVKK